MANLPDRDVFAEIELEVEKKYRELARLELERRVQELADSQGDFSPSERQSSDAAAEEGDPRPDDSGRD